MRRFSRLGACALTAAAFAALAIFPASASAHTATITISCTSVQFSYMHFPAYGTNSVKETVSIDGQTVASKTFTFSGSSATDTIPINGTNGETVKASATWTVGGGGSATASKKLSGCVPPCPTGTKANFRWHYSANGSSGSWSATKSTTCPGSISIGPQAMEGDLKVSPGTTLEAGYDFTVPGNNTTLYLTVSHAQVVFTVHCVSGATPTSPTFTVSMPTQTYTVPDSQWYPSGDQQSPLVYQGSIAVPNLCNGGQLRLDAGGTFSADVS